MARVKKKPKLRKGRNKTSEQGGPSKLEQVLSVKGETKIKSRRPNHTRRRAVEEDGRH